MNWTFTDSSNSVAYKIFDNGQMQSALVSTLPPGTSVDPYIPSPPSVPTVVSRFQARAAMAQAGHFSMVDDFMMALPKTDIRRLAWLDASEFDRSSPTLAAMAEMLGLDDAALDSLFLAAANIEA